MYENQILSLYFDSYGTKYPDEVEDFIGIPIGYTSTDLQSLINGQETWEVK